MQSQINNPQGNDPMPIKQPKEPPEEPPQPSKPRSDADAGPNQVALSSSLIYTSLPRHINQR